MILKKWRLFHHDGISTNEYKKGFINIDPGLGYWMIARESKTIETGEGRTVRPDTTSYAYNIELNPGWNQIGNPFAADISWDHVIIDNRNLNIGSVKLYSGDSLSDGDIIESYRGGFVFLDGGQPINVQLRPILSLMPGKSLRNTGKRQQFNR